ncbi:MAG: ABC transporter substrate-binding protein [Acidimicrobiales bacterium]
MFQGDAGADHPGVRRGRDAEAGIRCACVLLALVAIGVRQQHEHHLVHHRRIQHPTQEGKGQHGHAQRVRQAPGRTRRDRRGHQLHRHRHQDEQPARDLHPGLLPRRGEGLLRLPQQPGRHLRPQAEGQPRRRRRAELQPAEGARRDLPEGCLRGAAGHPFLATGWGDLDQAGIPTYVWGIDSQNAANRTHIFPSLAIRCDLCPRPSVPYVASKAGATRAASLGYGVSENSKQCTKAVAKAFDLYEDDSKVELAYTNDDLDYGLPNGIGPEVAAMKKAGVDFISTCIDLNGMKTLAQELHRQGMDDVTLYHPNSYDQGAIREAGSLFEGDVVSVQFRPFEDDAKATAMADFQRWMRKQGSKPSELAMTGWINASMAYDGLLAAGPKFDQQAAADGLNAQTDYTAGGLLEPIDWTKAHTTYRPDKPEPEPRSCAAFVKVHKGKLVPYEDPSKPWLCWKAGKKVPFTPTPTDFS